MAYAALRNAPSTPPLAFTPEMERSLQPVWERCAHG